MTFFRALLWLTSAVLGLGLSSAQGETKYFEVGTTLTLKADTPVPLPASIRWKYSSNLVVDWSPDSLVYYGSFNGRTTLDPQTLQLDINSLTLADSGQFSLETDRGPFGTHLVKVIKPPPKPSITTQPLACDANCAACALKCAVEVKDLGPVTYEWKKDEGEWTEGDQLKNMTISQTPEEFSCRVITRVSTSKDSDRKGNPCAYVPKPGPSPGVIVLIVIIILLVAVCAVAIAMVYKSSCKKADDAGEAGKKEDQPSEGEPMVTPPAPDVEKRNGENE